MASRSNRNKQASVPDKPLGDLPVRFRLPSALQGYIGEHENWCRLLREAESVTTEDMTWQERCAKGLAIPTRNLPPEILGRFYAQYCELINRMYEAYLRNMQLQKSEYMIEIISILIKRMYELHQELVFLIVNDYIYVDAALQTLFKTPYDIQIVVPYHFAKVMREDTIESMLQTMWRDAKIRKIKLQRKLEAKPKQKTQHSDPELAAMAQPVEEEVEEEEDFDLESETIDHDETLTHVLTIQRHERFRQFYWKDYAKKCKEREKYFVSQVPPVPKEVKERAAMFIQKAYRYFMKIKRKRFLDDKRDMMLGLIPDVHYRPKYIQSVEAEKLYEKRYQKRKAMEKLYLKDVAYQKTRLLWLKKGEQIEDITTEIIEWFKEWSRGYGFFPQYPYPLEGGTLVVVRGDYPTIEEQYQADEKWDRENKGLTPEQRKQSLENKKRDDQLKKEALREREKKEAEALFKARCQPQADPGYRMKTSAAKDDIKNALIRYRQAWSLFDGLPPEQTVTTIYGYIDEFLKETLMEKMYKECREYVDTLMRLELKLFIKVQKEMFKSIGQPYPTLRPRAKPPRAPRIPIPLEITDTLLSKLENVFDLEIMSKPTTRMDDIFGEFNYTNYEKNIQDPWAKYPSPGYGDVKRRLVLSCVFGSGVEPAAPRNKSVLLMGIPRNGKSFLVDAIAGEINAVKIDISPHVLGLRTNSPGKILPSVFQAARVFGPSIIFLKNIEKVFYKKVPPEERNENAKALKSPLTKLLKALPASEKVIFIATCSDPWAANIGPMMSLFSEKIYVPAPDYNTLQRFFYERLLKQIQIPRDLCVQPLARVFQGIGFGIIHEMYDQVLCPDRIVKLGERPFKLDEFMEYLLEKEVEPMTNFEYEAWMKLFVQYSPFKKEREEYEEINAKRAEGYEKIQKTEEAKEAKK